MAITLVENVGVNFKSTDGAIGAFTINVAVGDLIWAHFHYYNLGGSAISPVITDGVNSGNYTIVNSDFYTGWGGAGVQFVSAYKVATALGKPNVTTTLFSGGIAGHAIHCNGFLGTPTLDVATNPGGKATSAAINSGALTTTQPNDFAFAYDSTVTNTPVDPGAWSGQGNSFGGRFYAQSFATAGSNASFSTTVTSDTWYATVNAFYDGVAAAVTPNPFYHQRKVLYHI